MTKKGARNFSAPLLHFQVHLFNVVDSSKEVANKMCDDIRGFIVIASFVLNALFLHQS